MKAQFLAALLATSALLTACHKHEEVHAVDKLQEAEAAAAEKAPKVETVKFDDDGQPTFAETSGTAAKAEAAPADAPAADATAEAKDAPADAAKPAEAPATTEEKK